MFLVPCAAFHPCAFGFTADAFNEFPAKSLSLGETSHSAEGLVQFDSSGNASIRKMILRAVSPHPDPSGRGSGAQRAVERRKGWFVLSGEKGSPSPQGPQGRGLSEGKETTARRSVNVLDSSCGGCPQLYPDLSGFTISSLRLYPRSLNRSASVPRAGTTVESLRRGHPGFCTGANLCNRSATIPLSGQ